MKLIAAVLLLAPSVAMAQRVTGIVRDSGSRGVIAGAVVAELDSANNTLVRSLTDASGRYTLELRAEARTLRVVRIGFRPSVLPMQGLSTRSPLDVNMERVVALLTAVSVQDDRTCSNDARRVAALAVWEQARAGLLASIVAREAKPADAVVVNYERRIAAERQRVVSQTAKKTSGQTTRPFSAAASPAIFAERGYSLRQGTSTMFYAPDADVLLDESFARTHCFSVAGEDAEHQGAIGLAFEPSKRRDEITDVRGVLWMERDVPALRSIEYRYTGTDSTLTHRDARGMIHFRTMPNGVAFIDEWTARLPVLAERPGVARGYPARGRTTPTPTLRYDEFSETGGVVISSKWADGTTWTLPLQPLTGVVTDESSRRPMAGVIVSVAATGDTLLTDSQGRFTVFPLFPGKYLLSVTDTAMEEFVPPRKLEREITISPSGANVANAQLPGRAVALRRLCDDGEVIDRNSILLGRLENRDEPGKFPPGLSITASYLGGHPIVFVNGTFSAALDDQGVRVDDKGRFNACSVPREKAIRLVLTRGKAVVADTVVTLNQGTEVEYVRWPVSGARLFPK